ncbi:MAG: hypothetical protein ACREIU_02470 [Planctomycetota bacterium]
MGSSRSALTPLQRAFLDRFFGSVKGFYRAFAERLRRELRARAFPGDEEG